MLKYIIMIAMVCIAAIGFNLFNKNEPQVNQTKKLQSNKKGETVTLETATLAGGCFWCIETIFNDLKGVEKVVSGYSGGRIKNPTYEEVSSGNTGHAEVVQITFDPSMISYEQLLEIYFHIHDPTTLNKQGADVGTQYRSAIYYNNEEQKKTAESVKEKIGKSELWDDPIVTEITKLDVFYSAEDYHQDYYNNNKEKSYCSFVIAPKVRKFYKEYKDLLKEGVAN
ncbi:MAG: peptide-methionine (S)-S-oxide reductase MsrA [bacterium]|nr:peptide-methionine (S)-S-oxide reductase MsrA [bacterium]